MAATTAQYTIAGFGQVTLSSAVRPAAALRDTVHQLPAAIGRVLHGTQYGMTAVRPDSIR